MKLPKEKIRSTVRDPVYLEIWCKLEEKEKMKMKIIKIKVRMVMKTDNEI